ncbi:MAG: hypothetical protein PWR01_1998 [Clostridiales bacterium]|nr:hypothetical protein [Clostridiales bacterium]MDN5280925.1 hypothetical protein [Candidatus Ozemobacter sp.]
MNSERIEPYLKRAEAIAKECENFPDNQHFIELRSSLFDSIEFCRSQNFARPLIISIIGGTGTGKSLIFSKLFGEDSVSPSSDSVRGFTQKLFIAANETDRAFLNFGSEATYLPGVIEGAVLVDTPDLDTIHAENHELTKRLIETSDLLIYVTSPDKRSNFDINETILKWASRKRWLFVLNKIDTASDVDSESLKRDFRKKINELGFDSVENNIFAFSAREADSFEFNRLKNQIFSKKSFHQNALVIELACLRRLKFALESENTKAQINEIFTKLNDRLEKLNERLNQAQKQFLASSKIDNLTDQARIKEVYRQLADHRTLFMFPYVWAIARIGSGISPTDLALAYHRGLTEFDKFQECRKDEARILEDLMLNGAKPENDFQISEQLYSVNEIKIDLLESSRTVIESKTLIFYNFVANLLPVFILVQTLIRAFSSWMTANWLPADFFIHALLLMAGSTFPGYLLLSRGIARLSQSCDHAEFRSGLNANQLKARILDVSALLKNSNELRSQLEKAIHSGEKQLDSGYAGATKTDTDN